MLTGIEHHDLGAAAADVDDSQGLLDRPAGRGAEQVEQGLLLVAEDVERDARRLLDRDDHPTRVGRPAQGLGGHERNATGAERPSALGVADELRDQDVAVRRGDGAERFDGVAQAELDRLVGERVDAVADDLGDEEVDGVRPDIDGGVDARAGLRAQLPAAFGAGTDGFAAGAFARGGFRAGTPGAGGSAGATSGNGSRSASTRRSVATSVRAASSRDASFASRSRAASSAPSTVAMSRGRSDAFPSRFRFFLPDFFAMALVLSPLATAPRLVRASLHPPGCGRRPRGAGNALTIP